jgi:membrane fusion protein (multidrug efflux system)
MSRTVKRRTSPILFSRVEKLSPQERQVPEENKKNNNRKKSLVVIVLLVLIASAAGYYLWSRGRISTDDAYVDGHVFTITPRVQGYVTEVLVTDNQLVKKAEPLVTLDRTDFEVALAQAKATLAEAEATLISLELGVPLEVNQTGFRVKGAQAQLESLRKTLEGVMKDEDAAAQEVKRTQAQYSLSVIELKRAKDLRASKSVPQSFLDNAETASESSTAQLGAAKAKLESVKKQHASLEAEIGSLKANVGLAGTGEDEAKIKERQVDAQKAVVELARARLKQAELDLSYTSIMSPADGRVTKKRVEPGLLVSKGQPLMAVVPLKPEELWVTANYKETQLTHVKPGQKVIIRVDTYPSIEIRGKVDSIMAGTGAAFSLFPPENATGNFVKVVQRIPVKIIFDEKGNDSLPQLRIGMSVVPTILVD